MIYCGVFLKPTELYVPPFTEMLDGKSEPVGGESQFTVSTINPGIKTGMDAVVDGIEIHFQKAFRRLPPTTRVRIFSFGNIFKGNKVDAGC